MLTYLRRLVAGPATEGAVDSHKYYMTSRRRQCTSVVASRVQWSGVVHGWFGIPAMTVASGGLARREVCRAYLITLSRSMPLMWFGTFVLWELIDMNTTLRRLAVALVLAAGCTAVAHVDSHALASASNSGPLRAALASASGSNSGPLHVVLASASGISSGPLHVVLASASGISSGPLQAAPASASGSSSGPLHASHR